MLRKAVVSLVAVFAVVAFVSVASANVSVLKAGESSVCENASWIAYNVSETDETTLEFDIGPHAYSWGKVYKVAIPPGGYETNAMAKKTTFKNAGPGQVSVNCQRQRFDRHDWKIDPGSGKTYQSNYHLDHVVPGTYIEPGYGMELGHERGIGSVLGHSGELGR